MSFSLKETIANAITMDLLSEIEGVMDMEYPPELNAVIVIMEDGLKFRITVEEENC